MVIIGVNTSVAYNIMSDDIVVESSVVSIQSWSQSSLDLAVSVSSTSSLVDIRALLYCCFNLVVGDSHLFQCTRYMFAFMLLLMCFYSFALLL